MGREAARQSVTRLEHRAGSAHLWVCAACGKVAIDRTMGLSHGWDESCFLNAVLVVQSSVVFSKTGLAVRSRAVPSGRMRHLSRRPRP